MKVLASFSNPQRIRKFEYALSSLEPFALFPFIIEIPFSPAPSLVSLDIALSPETTTVLPFPNET